MPVDPQNITGRYILDEHGDPQPCRDLLKWARWMGRLGARRVIESNLSDGSWVSTIFLGIDHNHARFFGGGGRPVLFETMVFQNPDARSNEEGRGEALDQERYCTWDEAERAHYQMMAKWEAEIAKTTLLLAAIVKTPEPEEVK